MKIALLLNRSAGSLVDQPVDDVLEAVRRPFETQGAEVMAQAVDGADCTAAIARALASDADALVVGGGDGTVNSALRQILPTGKALGVLPLGTLNMLARDLNTPIEINAAASALANGRIRAIDVAEVNGAPYLNSSILGFYPTVVRERERHRRVHRWLKWPGSAWAMAKALYRLPLLDVQIDWGDGLRHVRTPILAVSNNLYDDGYGLPLRRTVLDGGRLGVYVARDRSALSLLRLMGRLALGRWKEDEGLDCFTVTRLTVASHRRALSMANDGEVSRLSSPLHYKIRPLALRVMASS